LQAGKSHNRSDHFLPSVPKQMLKETFIQLITKYTDSSMLCDRLWAEIEKAYSGSKRHYHNLLHLTNLLDQLTTVKSEIANWEAILFSLYYHDIVYNTLKTDNEEKSAALAEKRMREIQVPAHIIELTRQQIIATKSHNTSANADTNYFTDADLSILGCDWDEYAAYFNKIRKEYAVYPAIIYNPGRKKVLQHFLQMERIFKTEIFYQLYEARAKLNLQKEMTLY
jgi:predicted metal-dependent HD superfamily phosphohydrolase